MNTSINRNNTDKYYLMYDSEYSPIYDTPYDICFVFGGDDDEDEDEEYGYDEWYIPPASNSHFH